MTSLAQWESIRVSPQIRSDVIKCLIPAVLIMLRCIQQAGKRRAINASPHMLRNCPDLLARVRVKWPDCIFVKRGNCNDDMSTSKCNKYANCLATNILHPANIMEIMVGNDQTYMLR